MANLKNWLPDMDKADMAFFDKCPKAVLFEIARQFAMRVGDEFTADAALKVMADEWEALHLNGIVPQKPFKLPIHSALHDRQDDVGGGV